MTAAGFGSALAYDASTKTLWIGAPNYLRTFDSANKAQSTQPIGAVYGYHPESEYSKTYVLGSPILGSGGTAITLNAANQSVTSYWGSQFGTAIATKPDGTIAISAPGFTAGLQYSGTEQLTQKLTTGKSKNSPYGDGALIGLQLPSSTNEVSIASSKPSFQDVVTQNGKKNKNASDERYRQGFE